VEWKDGTTSWLPLKEIKETNPIEVASYAISNRIDAEPAFDWWVHDILHKKERLIKLSQKRAIRTGYKFGLRVPDNVSEAIELDRTSGNTLWHDAIMKEMTIVRVAFELKEKGSAHLAIGHKLIPMRDNLRHKNGLQEEGTIGIRGHLTDPPNSLIYSSVGSRDSFRIVLLLQP